MRPRDLFEQVQNSHLGHFPVVVKIVEREMRVRRRFWTPVSENEERKFQKLCLCTDGSPSWCDDDVVSGLEASQARVEGAAVEIRLPRWRFGTRTSSWCLKRSGNWGA